MSGFTSLQAAVVNAGGSIVQRARLTFAPLVLKTIASFTDEHGNVNSDMLALVATNVAACEKLIGTLDADAGALVVMLDAGNVKDSAGQAVTFASLKSHVANTCKTRKVAVAINVVRDSDSDPIGFTVRRITQ